MKQRFKWALSFFTLFFFSSYALAVESKIGVVDVNQLFNSSQYVQKANKELQDNVKKMETELKSEQQKLQSLVDRYQKTKKENLLTQIKDQQATLTKLTQAYQQKVQAEQNNGMQKFSEYVRKAVAIVAKDKHLGTVLNSNSIVFTDNAQLVDITKDVADEMAKNS